MTADVAIRRGFTVHPDAWLTGILDRPAFRVDTVDTPWCGWKTRLQSDDLFVTAKLGADQVAEAGLLQDLGFRTIDTALTFEASALTAPAADPRVRFACAEDRAAVAQLAGSAFVFSRFHLDPAIPTWLAHRVKAAWAENFFAGKRGDGMVVAEHAGTVAGFLQLLWSPGDVLVIDLIAVAPRSARSGLARAMIGFAAVNGVGDQRRPRSFRVGTQAANTPSVRLYESLGFRLSQAQFVLHHHGRSGPYLQKAGT
jgi:ribosomal protein S18 acetylase RimI-like enzyme